MRNTVLISVLVLATTSGLALADPEPGEYCQMWTELPAGTTGWLTSCPCGDGSGLDEMCNQTGDVVSGVIWVLLLDDSGDPIVGYPAEDLWLDSYGGSFQFIRPGTCADGPSDAEGLVVWREPLAAGGSALNGIVGYAGGQPLILPALQTVRFVSPDINGDLDVDLADLVPFTSDFVGVYNVRSDLAHDEEINLADLTVFSNHYGHGCP